MKKLLAMIIGAAVMCGCSNVSKPTTLKGVYEERLGAAETFSDSVVAVNGTFIGGIFNNRYRTYSHDLIGSDKKEMLRGIRTVLAVDTANLSYISGLQMGLEIMDVYREHAASEKISKEALLSVISEAFMLDSLNIDELREMQAIYQQMLVTLDRRAQERAQAHIYNSREAQENRMMGDAVISKYKTNPDFSAVGADGMLRKIVAAGSGDVLDPNLPVRVTITERRADSGQVIRSIAPRALFIDAPGHPVLSSVLPYMSLGETSVFIVPYTLAYGTPGDSIVGIGPCETIMAEVTVEPNN